MLRELHRTKTRRISPAAATTWTALAAAFAFGVLGGCATIPSAVE